jgi:glycolate oxidase
VASGLTDFSSLGRSLTDPKRLVTDIADYETYYHDATPETTEPDAILFAESEADILQAVRFCTSHNVPIVPRGAGTGLSGGAVPSPHCLVLSTEKMRLLRIDPRSSTAHCGPGVITKHLLDAAAEFGLTYPPDPASYEESTLGGNVAENAGGLRCKRFGVTRDYVIGLKAVTMDGELLTTGVYSDDDGFGIGDVLIGSEGTLAIITEIAVRLIPIPAPGTTILVAFDNPSNAARTVTDITRSGIIPTVLEYIDGDAASCSNQYEKAEGLDDAAAILLIETPGEQGEAVSEQVAEICRRNNCSYIRTESDPDKADQMWKVRRNISKAVKSMAQIRISEDVAVPNSKFPVLIEFVNRLNATSSLRINSYGHAGDGNLHVNFMSMTGGEDEQRLIDEAIPVLLREAVKLGGTLSGEHGIGLAKQKFLGFEFDRPTLDGMRSFKTIFDPSDLLNPHKIFPDDAK